VSKLFWIGKRVYGAKKQWQNPMLVEGLVEVELERREEGAQLPKPSARREQSACSIQGHLSGCKNFALALFYSLSTDASYLPSLGAPVHDALQQPLSLAAPGKP
jgi:hypothetical protein